MLLYILLGLAAIIVLVLIIASTKPNTVHYERSVMINAAPERILPHIHDYHNWLAWSPYEKLDPNMKREFSGPKEGRGARYAWEGNSKAGAGQMEIVEASTAGVKMDLNFTKPFKSDCIAHFVFEPQGSATKVTWSLDGPNIFMGKVMSVFMSMDNMVGNQFAEGLASLKALEEK